MKQITPYVKLFIYVILCSLIILNMIISGIHSLSPTITPIIIASAQEDTWNMTLQITETSGKRTSILLGGSPDALDTQDDLDRPEPPAPPETSYVQAWFSTSFSIPFNRLLQEYKHTPSNYMEWNLSILWMPESENNSETTISISWNHSKASHSDCDSFKLYKNSTEVANMLTENTYSFSSDNSLNNFQIIGQNIDVRSEQTDLPMLPIALGVTTLVIVILIGFFWYRRKY